MNTLPWKRDASRVIYDAIAHIFWANSVGNIEVASKRYSNETKIENLEIIALVHYTGKGGAQVGISQSTKPPPGGGLSESCGDL